MLIKGFIAYSLLIVQRNFLGIIVCDTINFFILNNSSQYTEFFHRFFIILSRPLYYKGRLSTRTQSGKICWWCKFSISWRRFFKLSTTPFPLLRKEGIKGRSSSTYWKFTWWHVAVSPSSPLHLLMHLRLQGWEAQSHNGVVSQEGHKHLLVHRRKYLCLHHI